MQAPSPPLSPVWRWFLACALAALLPSLTSCQIGRPVYTDISASHLPLAARRIISQNPPTAGAWRLLVSPAASPNASVAAAGTIILTSGLLRFCQNEPQLLAYILAHEISHHQLGHHRRLRIIEWARRAASLGLLALAADDRDARGWAAGAVLLLPALVTLPVARCTERAADRRAIHLLQRARLDPSSCRRFWEKLHRERPSSEPLRLLSTHPSDHSRGRLAHH